VCCCLELACAICILRASAQAQWRSLACCQTVPYLSVHTIDFKYWAAAPVSNSMSLFNMLLVSAACVTHQIWPVPKQIGCVHCASCCNIALCDFVACPGPLFSGLLASGCHQRRLLAISLPLFSSCQAVEVIDRRLANACCHDDIISFKSGHLHSLSLCLLGKSATARVRTLNS
jgi:hypothetical protein